MLNIKKKQFIMQHVRKEKKNVLNMSSSSVKKKKVQLKYRRS